MTITCINYLSMRQLTQIIEQLHNINEQIVEKDNMIDRMQPIVNLVGQMMKDVEFVKSEIYLDLRIKYLSQIEAKLNELNTVQSHIVIEPENVIVKPSNVVSVDEEMSESKGKSKSKSKDKCKDVDDVKKNSKLFTVADVNAPITTDIFQAPKSRHIYTRKKKSEKKDEIDTPKKSYVSFDHQNETYFIDLTSNGSVYEVYNNEMTLVGQLKEHILTLITDLESMKSETITLQTTTNTTSSCLFGQYVLNVVK